MLTFSRRIAVAMLVLHLSGGGFSLCSGWTASPAARMACCEDEGACPEHSSPDGGAFDSSTQAAADLCCATSERNNSSEQASVHAVLPAMSIVTVISHALTPTTTPGHSWPSFVPPPGRQAHTHLLFSVFLI